jgi:hypothetical protein
MYHIGHIRSAAQAWDSVEYLKQDSVEHWKSQKGITVCGSKFSTKFPEISPLQTTRIQ